MPLYTNTTKGTVSYGTGEFDTSDILDNDIEVLNSTTFVNAFKVPIGPNERVHFRAFLYFDYHADGDLKYKITTPGTTSAYRHILRESEMPIDGAITETTTMAVATTGLSSYAKTGATGTYFAWVQYGVLENGATAGELKVEFAQNSASATQATKLKAGSYIEYIKF
tara:strand:- start:53 stop:553 length:501 start_codon:yes stop_codon:yes gene_type:complete